MQKQLLTLLFALLSVSSYSQDPVLTYSGDLYFIPGSMTKSGEAFMVTINQSEPKGFNIYDGDFKVVQSFTDPSAGISYQQRVVTKSCIYDLNVGMPTRAAVTDWAVVDDQTETYKTESAIEHFEMFSDNNSYHSRSIYVTQTLFDDDDDFEYVRRRVAIIPIDTKAEDYIKEHSTNSGAINYPSYGNEAIDEMMRETGADSFDQFWDEEAGKYRFRLYKHEYYGGTFTEGIEIATLGGTVKAFLPGISYISSVYNFRNKCYVRGYNNNSQVLYLLGNNTTGIKEVKRDKSLVAIKRMGDNLIVDNTESGDHTIVLSNMGGQVLRNVKATNGSTIVPLHGLMGGVYNVTLFKDSKPVKSAKVAVNK